jgi:isopentenyl phosphate kinase
MDSMTKIVQFLSKEDMPRRLITMKTRIWGCYRKRVLFHINEMCKQAMNPAQYGHMSIDKEMHCADNIMVAHYNMNQVVIFSTSTIGVKGKWRTRILLDVYLSGEECSTQPITHRP